MATVGRTIRWAMRDAAAETSERGAERIRAREAGERAHADALAHFGAVTPENAGAFVAWQEARIRALLTAPSAPPTPEKKKSRLGK